MEVNHVLSIDPEFGKFLLLWLAAYFIIGLVRKP